jgi:hypothetical protein
LWAVLVGLYWFRSRGIQMVFMISQKNGCTYTLDPECGEDLMYAPLLSDGSYETTLGAYDFVEWESFDPFTDRDILEEAARCHRLLLADVPPA